MRRSLIVELSEDATPEEIEESAWKAFAYLHPHEANASYPDRFWAFFQEMCPGKSRDFMEQMLRETEND